MLGLKATSPICLSIEYPCGFNFFESRRHMFGKCVQKKRTLSRPQKFIQITERMRFELTVGV